MGQWSGGLLTFSESLASLEGVIAAKGRLQSGWAAASKNLVGDLEAVREKVKARPDKSVTAEAGSLLVVAQERPNNVRTAKERGGKEGKRLTRKNGLQNLLRRFRGGAHQALRGG